MTITDMGLRSSVGGVLRNNGVRSLEMGHNLEEMQEYLAENSPDLIISSTVFPDGELYPKLLELRHNEWGQNPFIPIITITNQPDAQLVKKVLESGADDLIVAPVSINICSSASLAGVVTCILVCSTPPRRSIGRLDVR